MKQFTSKYGCVYCENPGVTRPQMPMIRDWPPENGELRTHTSFVKNAQDAISRSEVVCSCIQLSQEYTCIINMIPVILPDALLTSRVSLPNICS